MNESHPRKRPRSTGPRVANGDKHLEFVPVSEMRISPRAQRSHDGPSSRAKIQRIADNFDADKFGTPTVNWRDGIYWVLDGGHRYLALVEMGYEDQAVQCWLYEGLTEAEEADKFLALNDVKPVSGMDKYQRAIVAKHPEECEIDRLARAQDVVVGTGKDAIGCIGAVRKTYAHGPSVLSSTLRIIRDAYGRPGFSAKVTEGIGLFVANYEKSFNEAVVVEKLAKKKGGVNGLLGEAERIKIKYGVSIAVGVAAATVETYNQGLGRAKLNGWWSTFGDGA